MRRMTRLEYRLEFEKAIQKTGRSSWQEYGYAFNFGSGMEEGTYTWNGRKLHITPGEALHLYQRLIGGRVDTATTSPGALSRMRKRFGAAFLEEALPNQRPGSPKPRGRKSDFRMEVEGVFTKKERARFEEARRRGLIALRERQKRENPDA